MTAKLTSLVIAVVAMACVDHAQAQDFAPYSQAIPGSGQIMPMVPVAGGRFNMGSQPDETGHQPHEAPQHAVTVGDFWMGQYEISWQQYDLFVHRDDDSFGQLTAPDKLQALSIDGLTGATTPYVEMSFGMGKEGYPAINITQYAALHYARWLSAKTGHFYRLPTEAEWEYACRAGTSTPWSFGDNSAMANEYAIHAGNSEEHYALVGSRRSNPWDLYDMHGNVAEWTMDQFDPGFYSKSEAENPWNRPTELYPRVTRGGSWIHTPEQQRCASRLPSAANWKERDPQIPKSDWWLTNAPFVGFRLVRPRTQPPAEDIARYWLEAIEDYGI